MKQLLERAFFGKDTCLIVSFSAKNECYFQFGKKNGNEWTWKKVKMNDVELGDIIMVLEGRRKNISFYHSFTKDNKTSTTQLWVDRLDNDSVAFRVKEATRALLPGEQQVLLVLLKHIILMTNLQLA